MLASGLDGGEVQMTAPESAAHVVDDAHLKLRRPAH
jgi:hypothetical protein